MEFDIKTVIMIGSVLLTLCSFVFSVFVSILAAWGAYSKSSGKADEWRKAHGERLGKLEMSLNGMVSSEMRDRDYIENKEAHNNLITWLKALNEAQQTTSTNVAELTVAVKTLIKHHDKK